MWLGGVPGFEAMHGDPSSMQSATELPLFGARYGPMADLVWLKDLNGVYLACNRAFQAYLGATEAQILGKNANDFTDAETARRHHQIERQAVAQTQPLSIEEWLTYPDGRRRRMRTTVTGLYGADNEPISILGVAHDITDQPRGDGARYNGTALFRALVEQSTDWIWAIDTRGHHTYSNAMGSAMLGYGEAEFLRINPETLIHPDDLALYRETYRKALAGQTGWRNVVLRWRHRDGGYRHLESSSTVLVDETGQFLGFQGIDRDVTELRRRLEADQQLASIVQYAHDFIGIADMKGNIQFVNQAGRALVGLAPTDDPQGRTIPDFVHATSRALMVEEILPQVLATGHWSGELQFRDFHTDGAIPVLSECFRIDDAAGNPINIATVSRDIIERKRNERMQARHNRVLHTIASLNEMMMAEADEQRLMATICEALVKDNQFRMAWIGRVARDGVRVQVVAGAGLGYDYLSRVDIRCDQSPQGRGPTGEAIRQRRTIINEDTASNRLFAPWRALALSKGYRSSAATPLRACGKVIGAVNLYSDEPNAFGPDEVVLLEKLTADLGLALERRMAEAALRESEERYRQISSVTTDVLFSCVRGDGGMFRIDWAAGSLDRVFGYSVDEVIERGCWRCFVHPDDLSEFDAHIASLCPGQSSECELRIIHKDGSLRFLQTYSKVVATESDRQGDRLYGACQDITEHKAAVSALAESEQRYRALFNASGDCILVLRGDRIVDCNTVTTRILAHTREEIIGQSIIRFSAEIQPDGRRSPARYREIIDEVLHGQTRIFEWRLIRHNGSTFDAEVSVTNVDLGSEAHLIANLRDISERKQAEERIEFLAHHDALTGLPNRILLRDRFDQALAFAERGGSHVAMLFLDLDNFKVVNDTLGHAAGDRLLQTVVSRLGECMRDTDTVSRQGGDEFIVLLNDIYHPEAVERIAGDVLKRLAEPMEIDGHVLNMPCSIGISVYPEDGRNFDTLLQKADTAMYNAKDAGRNTYRFFDEEMNRRAREHLLLQNRLHQALRNGELSLHFQPQLHIGSDSVLGVEALLRWKNPELGDVPPGRFIPVAEDCGVIVPIGTWVLGEACRQAQEWRLAGLGDLSVSVNLSALQFRRTGLVEAVSSALDKSGLPAHLLELELTESMLLKHLDQTLEAVHRLKGLGVRLAIDDFGTGYSSLSYLKRFAVDKLKIDQTFVRDIGSDPDDAAIVRAIIELARGLHLEIVAEGVETEGQLAFLRQAGCQEIQGYLFSRPLAADAFEDFLRNRSIH